MLFTIGRESKRAYISLKYPILAIHAKGEKVLAQSKRTAPPPIFKKLSYEKIFQLVILPSVSYF
jgi:hypothetical protein